MMVTTFPLVWCEDCGKATIPNDAIPSRRLTRRECRLHDLMADLADAGRLDEAQACREDLWKLSAIRSGLATVEHDSVREKV